MEKRQVDINHKAYDKYREDLEKNYPGMVALMRDSQLRGLHSDLGNAYHVGRESFGEGEFSLVCIGEEPVELGAVAIGLT